MNVVGMFLTAHLVQVFRSIICLDAIPVMKNIFSGYFLSSCLFPLHYMFKDIPSRVGSMMRGKKYHPITIVHYNSTLPTRMPLPYILSKVTSPTKFPVIPFWPATFRANPSWPTWRTGIMLEAILRATPNRFAASGTGVCLSLHYTRSIT